ncbi:MAG: hypothetical protein IJ634_05830 [Bacteroidales bacterium]|nr:hypothetical protein [Bacteroidales bacterium]
MGRMLRAAGLFFLFYLSFFNCLQAQVVPLHRTIGIPLYLDLDRVYNYNQYEKSRWGLGLRYGYLAEDLDMMPKPAGFFDRLSVGAYVGYGYADERWKWGVDAGYWTDLERQGKVYAAYFHDLTAEATRSLNTYNLVSFNASGSFMNRLFSDTRRLTAGYSMVPTRNLKAGLELRLSDERKLHNLAYILYPQTDDEWDALEHARFAEGRLFFEHNLGLRGELTLGYTTGEWWVDTGYFLRLLLQYDQVFPVAKIFNFQVYAQGGITTKGTPFSRLFNLGGTSGSPLLFERSLLTARLDEFLANRFVLTCLRFGFSKPLFTLKSDLLQVGTAPRPFVLLDAAWGDMWDFQNIGPDRGIAEAGVGIDGIVRWGYIDWGLALAYRLTPENAYYHLPEPSNNVTLIFTAAIAM